jgi:hypothetical protein
MQLIKSNIWSVLSILMALGSFTSGALYQVHCMEFYGGLVAHDCRIAIDDLFW